MSLVGSILCSHESSLCVICSIVSHCLLSMSGCCSSDLKHFACIHMIRYVDTIEEYNVDLKAEYTA